LKDLIGKKCKVYLNLHKMQWAIKMRVDGKEKVVGYTDHITIMPEKLHIGESTRLKIKEKFETTGKREKNVHAWVVGTIIDFEPKATDGHEISYNPYFEGYYYTRHDLKPFNDITRPLYLNAETKYCYQL
jgi:hypothetical protein